MSTSLPASVRYAISAGACALTTFLLLPLRGTLDLANAVMLLLLLVFLVALKLGRGPAVLAAFLSVALFDFFFVPPHFSFAVSDVYYLITFAVMLAVGLLTTGLTANVQEDAERAQRHEQETRDLYDLARNLTGITRLDQVQEAVHAYLAGYGFDSRIYLLDHERNFAIEGCDVLERQLVHLAFDQGEPVASDAESPSSTPALYLPLKAPMAIRGVIAISPLTTQAELSDSRRELFMTMASLSAIAIERLHYVEVAQHSQIQMSAEKLKGSVLSALSHDLRTPLTALVGMTDALAQTPQLPVSAQENAVAIRDQAHTMSNMLTNLLDMARLQAGKVTLRREWQLFEDAISASLQLQKNLLGTRKVVVELEKNLPLVFFDAVLLERVLCNLIENAVKYSADGHPIHIGAFVENQQACIAVCDQGISFPAEQIERLFELFERGETESTKPGIGLGLGICKAIIEAHGGVIAAENRQSGGACVTLRLPLGNPPAIVEEVENV